MLIASVTESLITAGAGLVGAIGGTLAGGSVTRNAERQRQKAEGAAAWRLMRAELGDALDAVHEIRGEGAWPIGWHRSWSAVWREARRPLLLAPPPKVDDDALSAVEHACAVLDQLENAVNAHRPDSERPLMGRDQIFLWEMQSERLGTACRVLGYASKVTSPRDPTADELRYWDENPESRARASEPG